MTSRKLLPLNRMPFLLAARELDAKKLPYSWHQADGSRQLACRFDEQSFARAEQERLGEDLRKLYVALTRARHGCVVTLAALKERSALGYLLSADGVLAPQAQWLPVPLTLSPAFGHANLQTTAPLPYRPWASEPQQTKTDGFAMQGIAPRPSWTISSYSALAAGQHSNPLVVSAEDSAVAAKTSELLAVLPDAQDGAMAADQSGFAQQFVRGAGPGTFLHEQLEWAAAQGFAAVLAEPALLLTQLASAATRAGLIRRHPDGRWQRLMLQSDKEQTLLFADASQAVAALADWLLALLQQPLPVAGALSLARLPACIAELEFLLPAAKVDLRLLDLLVQQQLWPGLSRPELQPRQLNGMLKGFVDLTLFDGERYYVADFKSNYREDGRYHPKELQQMMLEARYDLQAALYGLALHRLLSARLVDYQPERHIGPALYWFLRGSAVPAAQGQGVLAVPLSAAFILALDALFRGDTAPARQLLPGSELHSADSAGSGVG